MVVPAMSATGYSRLERQDDYDPDPQPDSTEVRVPGTRTRRQPCPTCRTMVSLRQVVWTGVYENTAPFIGTCRNGHSVSVSS